jgi:hypothetical protein
MRAIGPADGPGPSGPPPEAASPPACAEPDLAAPGQQLGPSPGQPEPAAGAESCVLKLKGLPYSTGEAAIREFFAGYSVSGPAGGRAPDLGFPRAPVS